MVDVLHPPRPAAEPTPTPVPGQRSRLALELRELAEDMAGHLDRDELTVDEGDLLAAALDEVVAAVLPRVCTELEAELSPRVEALPLHARVALMSARQRRLLGRD